MTDASHKKAHSTERATVQYLKPHILLMDIEIEVAQRLTAAGFSVSEGEFGTPYKIDSESRSSSNYTHARIPVAIAPEDVAEQEIVVIDMTAEPVNHPYGEPVYNQDGKPLRIYAPLGLLDPRSISMRMLRTTLDRIYSHGGIFIIFAKEKEIVRIKAEGAYRTDDEWQDHNWTFLSIFDQYYFTTRTIRGAEINTEALRNTRIRTLEKYISHARYHCAFDVSMDGRWVTLATNKYGDDVAGVILPNEVQKGFIFVLPDVQDKAGFLHELLTSALPEIAPSLFPYFEGTKWLHNPEYELPEILSLQQDIENIRSEYAARIQLIEDKIAERRTSLQFMYDLLTQSDQRLVDAVAKAFQTLGFHHVVDMDSELTEDVLDKTKREDLQVRDGSPLLLIEVKGIAGTPTDSDALQVMKYLFSHANRYGRTDLHGLSIINHQKNLPPHERRKNPFNKDVLNTTAESHVGLMTTWALYKLVRSFTHLGWKHDDIVELLFQSGFIDPIPAHYEYLGVIEHFYAKAGAFVLTLEGVTLKRGDRIAFDLENEFVEQVVESLKVDDKDVEEAHRGDEIGVKTTYGKEQLGKGVRVFQVRTEK